MKKNSIHKRIAIRILNQFFGWLPDKEFIKFKFYLYAGYWPNLTDPRTFNEKLQWLKLHNRHDIHTQLVDKVEVKKYVAEKIGDRYIIPTLAVYTSANDIKLNELPNKFVLKCSHNSGGIIICKNKKELNYNQAREVLSTNLKQDYFKVGREWAYKNVKPRIIAEKLLENNGGGDLRDYKFFCFNGKVKCCLVCADRFESGGVRMNFYDPEWRLLPFSRHYDNIPYPIKKPEALHKMIELAETLAADFKFVRVDLYVNDKNIYFGEMTFFPGNGWAEFDPIEWDYKLGRWLNLGIDGEQKY